MLRRNFIKNASLIMLCNVLTGIHTLSAQALASLDVKQAELDLSNTVRLLEQYILLALSAGVAFLRHLRLLCHQGIHPSNCAQLKVERDL